MLKTFLITVFTLLVPGVALAAGGWLNMDGINACGGMSPGSVCFYEDGGTTDSPTLTISDCRTITLHYNSDTSGVIHTAEANLRACQTGTKDAANCNIVYSDAGVVTLNGDETVGRSAIYGVQAWKIWIDSTANPATTKTWRAQVICH